MTLALFSIQFKTLTAAICACVSGVLGFRTSGFKFYACLVTSSLMIYLTLIFLRDMPKG